MSKYHQKNRAEKIKMKEKSLKSLRNTQSFSSQNISES